MSTSLRSRRGGSVLAAAEFVKELGKQRDNGETTGRGRTLYSPCHCTCERAPASAQRTASTSKVFARSFRDETRSDSTPGVFAGHGNASWCQTFAPPRVQPLSTSVRISHGGHFDCSRGMWQTVRDMPFFNPDLTSHLCALTQFPIFGILRWHSSLSTCGRCIVLIFALGWHSRRVRRGRIRS